MARNHLLQTTGSSLDFLTVTLSLDFCSCMSVSLLEKKVDVSENPKAWRDRGSAEHGTIHDVTPSSGQAAYPSSGIVKG